MNLKINHFCWCIFILTLYWFSTANSADWSKTHQYTDRMSAYDKKRLYNISSDLITENKLLERQLGLIRENYGQVKAYQIGLVIGKLREKYKRMMDIYLEMEYRRSKKNMILGPGIWDNKPLHYILAMEQVRGLEVSIDKMIDTLNKTAEAERDIQQHELVSPEIISKYQQQQNEKRLKLLESNTSVDLNRPGGPTKFRPNAPGMKDSPPNSLRSRLHTPLWTYSKIQKRGQVGAGDAGRGNEENEGGNLPASKKFKTEQEVKDYYREQFEKKRGGAAKSDALDQYFGFG